MNKKVLFVSLGCDKNLVDTEVMLGLLQNAGFELTYEEAEADVIVVNTCCFIGDAKEESINTILEMAAWKERGRCQALVVTGCLAQRYREEVLTEMPEVDAVLGTTSYEEIVRVITGLLSGEKHTQVFRDINALPQNGGERILTTGGHYAFLKIAEGCDKRCTYCVIPSVRGNYRSVPMEQLILEARLLAAKGVKELILIAQETTLYGVDLYGHKALPELLARLSEIPGIFWIRLQYCYPEEITEELIAAIRDLPKVCHYLDIPIQHASDRVLRRMGRRTTREDITGIIRHLREEIPDIALRTTLITGFPGESEEDFAQLMDFVDEMEFDRLGVFPYSQEEGTPAAAMPDQIPEEVKLTRRDEVMELQQDIAFAAAEDLVGRELTVMVEGYLSDGDVYAARTYRDSPNVDGYLFLPSEENLMTGDLVRVRVTGAAEYDLLGEII
ncbi:MAG: 30S ribosomal protein S12 methylthiotransferase RimO [Lachnospiraceae bacterium]|nr:30S ribosomal protein S12 methylthiotransferase RimO [Lachnospiraceae bacterium]